MVWRFFSEPAGLVLYFPLRFRKHLCTMMENNLSGDAVCVKVENVVCKIIVLMPMNRGTYG